MVNVTAAIFRNEAGQIYLCRRGAGGSCAYLWEFPGGKQESGETLEECLMRECREELCAEIEIFGLRSVARQEQPDRTIELYFFDARLLNEPDPQVHVETVWVWPKDLCRYEFCPLDTGVAKELAAEADAEERMKEQKR